jgi:hypothetical protein
MRRRAFSAALGVLLAIGVTGTVFADSCANLSRPPAPCGFTCDHVVVDGNWVWLPSLSNVGETDLPPVWGFAPPGAFDSTILGLPGSSGNYQNGFSSWLLGHSAYCLKGVNTDKSHGIISGCE